MIMSALNFPVGLVVTSVVLEKSLLVGTSVVLEKRLLEHDFGACTDLITGCVKWLIGIFFQKRKSFTVIHTYCGSGANAFWVATHLSRIVDS
jgi:hypothetical protein